MLSQTIEVGMKTKVIDEKGFEKVNADTTVQEKAIAFPTDAKLYYQMRERLVRKVRKTGLELRQSYVRKARQELVKVGRYGYARQYVRMRRHSKKLKTYLGRVIRDIERKCEGDKQLIEMFAEDLRLAKRLYEQEKTSKHKL